MEHSAKEDKQKSQNKMEKINNENLTLTEFDS